MSIFFCPIRFQRRFGPQSSTRSSCSSDIYHTHTCIQQSFNNTSLILTRQWKKMPWRQWNVTCQHTIYNLYLWHTAGWFKHIKQSFAPEQQRLKWVGLSSRVFLLLGGHWLALPAQSDNSFLPRLLFNWTLQTTSCPLFMQSKLHSTFLEVSRGLA